mgnify:CR=1 FL=1
MNIKTVINTQLYHRTTHETDLVIVYDYIGTDENSLGQKGYSIHFMKVIYNPSAKTLAITSSFSPIAAVTNIDHVLPTIIILSGRISILYRKNN